MVVFIDIEFFWYYQKTICPTTSLPIANLYSSSVENKNKSFPFITSLLIKLEVELYSLFRYMT